MKPARLLAAAAAVLGVSTTGAALLGTGTAAAGPVAPPAVRELRGAVHLVPGTCRHGRPAGSYLAVTFGTRAIRNPDSQCESGAVTLLRPQAGLLSGRYAEAASSVFDHHRLGIATAAASHFAAPRIYLVGNQLATDLRSVQATYDAGTWPVGAEKATGHYNAASRMVSLQWFSGQSFTAASAGTEVHLVGRFVGSVRRIPAGTTVDLGTASFDAGSASAVDTAAGRSAPGRSHATGRGRSHRGAGRQQAAQRAATTSGSPKAFLLAELLVLANLVTFVVGLSRRRGRQ
jgi:hypothetical protein